MHMSKFYTQKSFGIPAKVICSLLLLLSIGAYQNLDAQISGQVFRDYNANGSRQTGASYNEPLVKNMTVNAYNNAGVLMATTTTGTSGTYSFTSGQIAPGTKVRLEFVGLANGDKHGAYGSNNKSAMQKATAPATGKDYGVNYPGDYRDNANARIIIPGYTNGDNTVPGAWPNAADGDGIYAFNYDMVAAASIVGKQGQTGALWATAYNKQSDKMYYAATVRRHVSFGPLGINGLYVTDNASSVTNTASTGNFVNLNSVNPAFDAGAAALAGRSFAPGNAARNQPNNDALAFDAVGKKGIGGMTISDDGRYLYLINLNDRKLWRVELGANGTAPILSSQIVAYNAFPIADVTNASFRPYGVKFYRGAIYIGGVMDGVAPGGATVDRAELKAIVLKVDASVAPGSATFSTVLNAPLTYNRRANMNTGWSVNKNSNYVDPNGTIAAATTCQGSWHPWARNFTEILIPPGTDKAIYPQPMLTGIEFDPADGSMILGLTDRTGSQTGNANRGTSGSSLYTGNAGGDIMKAGNTNGDYSLFTMESNGTAGDFTTAGAGNNEGPGGGEFYFTDRFRAGYGGSLGIGGTTVGNENIDHEENSLGSLAMFPGKELIAAAFDPITTWFTGGVRTYDNATGVAKNGKVLYQGADVSVFGKANGLGDLEIITKPAPLEIGNHIWFDANANGVQDAEESGIENVTVQLLSGASVIATAVTDIEGNYIFSNDPSRTSTGSQKYNIAGLTPNATYTVRIPNVQGGSVQTALAPYQLTLADNGGLAPFDDERDSDGQLVLDNADIVVSTGEAGNNNHSIDCGFVTLGTPVGPGGGGGVESKSLGDAIAQRVFNRSIKGENGPVNYASLPEVRTGTLNRTAQSMATGTALKLKDVLPTSIRNTSYKAFETTPKDILGITNAQDVLAYDFVEKTITKAVSFGTETKGEVYNHTKPVCDRLKGYTLQSISTMTVKGYELIQFSLKNNDGNVEYATSFVVGAQAGRNNYTIQSKWLNADYVADEKMYNVQLWGGTPSLVSEMAADVITRLSAGLPLQATGGKTNLPKTYVTSGARILDNLTLNIENTTGATNAYLEIKDRNNEQTNGIVTRTIPVTLSPNGKTVLQVPSGDILESSISLYVNGVLQDNVFMADGAWGVDYNTNTSNLKSFVVTNSKNIETKDVYPLFRNASVEASTPDYVSLYKLIRGGGVNQNLTDFKSLKFTAKGSGNVQITLVKSSITDYRNQFVYNQVLSKDEKEYVISLSDFKSAASAANIDMSDLNTVVFTTGSTTGRNTEVNMSFSKVAFSKEDPAYAASLLNREITVYPNPVSGRFNIQFKADQAYGLTLKVTEVGTGKVMKTQQVSAVKGDNILPVEVNQPLGSQKIYILSLDGSGVRYQPKKLVGAKQ